MEVTNVDERRRECMGGVRQEGVVREETKTVLKMEWRRGGGTDKDVDKVSFQYK